MAIRAPDGANNEPQITFLTKCHQREPILLLYVKFSFDQIVKFGTQEKLALETCVNHHLHLDTYHLHRHLAKHLPNGT